MDKETAKSIILIALSMEKQIDEILYIIDKKVFLQEKKDVLQRAVQDLVGHICIDLLMPITEIYPDLNPKG